MAREWVPFCFHKDLKAKERNSHLFLVIWDLQLVMFAWSLVSHQMNSRAQQYSLHDFRGFYCGSGRVSRLSKVILSIPGCLLKIPCECVSRIKGHSDSLPNLNGGKKKSFFTSKRWIVCNWYRCGMRIPNSNADY